MIRKTNTLETKVGQINKLGEIMGRVWTEEQREAQRKRFEEVRARRGQKKAEEVSHENNGGDEVPTPVEPEEQSEPIIAQDQDTNDLKRQILEMKQNMDLMRQALLNQNQQGVDRAGKQVGEFDKYLVDPANYPDPTPRLAAEKRLLPLAFQHNYDLDYTVGVSAYETKTGQNVREPKFSVTLYRRVLDNQGNQVKVINKKTGKEEDKFYIARKMIFHEDPQAAMVIARENDVIIDKTDERLFLNEMRYLRVRDWLFDIFWPRPSDDEARISEEAIGGQIVQVFTRKSEDTGSIPFDQLGSKLRT